MGKEILLIIVNLMFSDLEILYARVQKLEWSYIRRVLSVTNADVRANGILKMLQTNMWSGPMGVGHLRK